MDIQRFYEKIYREEQQDAEFLHLTANEPYVSQTAQAFMGSRLADRYYMGGGKDGKVEIAGVFTTLGMAGVEGLVQEATRATKQMLGATAVNLNCLSGLHAMTCAVLSMTEPGDGVMTVNHDHGGHFATQGLIERTGRRHVPTSYNFDTLSFDADAIAETFQKSGARAFYMDASYYINPHNLTEVREALGDDAVIIYDASHTMGLIMGGEFQDPLREGADAICANTHKTLPGPQKGMITFRDEEVGDRANDLIDGYMISSSHTASLIALSTTILEMEVYGREYAQQTISNSNMLGEALAARGYLVRRANTGRYSENHQVHLITESLGDNPALYSLLHRNNMNVNFDSPNILQNGKFIRLGTQEITRRGMKEAEMVQIAEFLDRGLHGEQFTDEVRNFISSFQQAHYSFDDVNA